MSHVATVELEVKDLESLAKACDRLGLELRLGQKTYKWWGTSVGDYPIPAGFTADELGKCEHAIGPKPGAENNSDWMYEVGVCRRKDGKSGYVLLWDFFEGGYGLQEKVGENCSKLKQMYGVEVAKKQARLGGFSVKEQWTKDGVKLTLAR